MNRSKTLFAVLLVLGVVLLSAGCKKSQPTVTPEPADTGEVAQPTREEPKPVEVTETFKPEEPKVVEIPPPSAAELSRQLQNIYFAFDKYDLSDESRRILQGNTGVLKEHASFRVVIEGHCDERGTIESNLALGEKRARAVRDYMVSLGLSPSRLRIVSFGEERPSDPGHNENAWAKNRRAEFKAEQ